MTARCCGEHGCGRRRPILVRLTPFGKRWVAITDYVERSDGIIVARQKHDIHEDLTATLIAEGWTPPLEITP